MQDLFHRKIVNIWFWARLAVATAFFFHVHRPSGMLRAMRSAFALTIVVACHHREPAPIVRRAIVQVAPEAERTTAVAPVGQAPLPTRDDDASLRVFVTHRGRPLGAGWDCHFAVFEDAKPR